ncbi:PREDICTED: beta-microseminoprotein-like [Nestor notabilis]|uniref:beta-microseminoprotein-like n=1 Tax=Nestor notabilis TaxID=176057 RepID=UPI000523521F|nr:PREDICTED: beta-microseminoprotein-like [Nestor notabilis]
MSEKTIWACLLVLALSMPLSNAYCVRQPWKPEKSDGKIVGCRDLNGELHELDSQWRTDSCYDCSCSEGAIDCCSSFSTPSDYDKENCVSIFNKETCTYKVVEKDDHSKECPVHAWVG